MTFIPYLSDETLLYLRAGIPAVLFFLCLLHTLWRWSHNRRLQRLAHMGNEDGAAADGKAVSVVMVCHNEQESLREHLPLLLEQEGVTFEVIVVLDNCSDDSEDTLELLEKDHPNLHHTFIPPSARYVCHSKLGITLGIKAARYAWVLLTRAACRPRSKGWLAGMSACQDEDTDLVLGAANLGGHGGLWRHWRVYRRSQQTVKWLLAAKKGAVGGDGCNMMLRRERFLQERGYAGQVNLLCGDDDLLCERLGQKGRVRVCLRHEAMVEECLPAGQGAVRRGERRHAQALRHLSLRSRRRLIHWSVFSLLRVLIVTGGTAGATALLLLDMRVESGVTGLALLFWTAGDCLLLRTQARMLRSPIRFFPLYELWNALSWPARALGRHMGAKAFRRSLQSQG